MQSESALTQQASQEVEDEGRQATEGDGERQCRLDRGQQEMHSGHGGGAQVIEQVEAERLPLQKGQECASSHRRLAG